MTRSALICHHGDKLNEEGIARWLASFTDLCLIVSIQDPKKLFWKRLCSEKKRSGILGLFDVFAFRIWFRLFRSKACSNWQETQLTLLRSQFPSIPASCRVLLTDSPNSLEVESALKEANPDFVIARCKRILKKGIFSIPPLGTFVIHPGICPAYRNAHGCFWAIVNDDYENVGATLLQIDEGIDTGPILGFLHLEFDPVSESHIQIQDRAVFENLPSIETLLKNFEDRHVEPLVPSSSRSRIWGQPRLSSYLKWRRRNRSRATP